MYTFFPPARNFKKATVKYVCNWNGMSGFPQTMYDIKTRAAYCLLLWVLLLSHQEPAGGDQLDPGSEKHNFILYCATNQQ